MKVLIVVGARPNFIKVTPILKEFKKYNSVKSILVHTGQHYDFEMSQIFFKDLEIPKPNYNLGVGVGSHARQTAKIMEKLEPVILREKPDLVIVVGDVNSTLAGALTAAKLNIPVVHVEAGLRSYDKTMPEEINRLLTDHISKSLFCPTETAVKNLKKEGIKKGLYRVGDIMYDTLLNSKLKAQSSKLLRRLRLKPKQYLLLTIHRASNTDNLENLRKIITTIGESGEKVVFPIHPRTKKQLKKLKLKIKNWKLRIIAPLGYLDMLVLENNAKKILTDSGGVQKEAYWLKVPCLTLRKETEWIETVKDGWNILVGQNKVKILKAIKNFQPKGPQHRHFGNGRTAKMITNILLKNYGK
ncbi:MAG: UDP-N-acetylglucosamine 2-epimerase (non-hydrolyzing) [Candidatus Pacebacteria bacterium]|nr:UDP-N-acetylglucosamine 2-epimerase (non-hydrolyzing) [Candidatus Paceibacterota bacterium]